MADDTVDRDGAYVEALVEKLGPMLDPEDFPRLADLARRAGERNRLRALLCRAYTRLDRLAGDRRGLTPAARQLLVGVLQALEDTADG